ncbi:MAG: EamA family transporter [Rhodospirillales bacterium]|nr:MAG: EamA family transporter [Rhodospirillales bacterium]
MGTVLALLAAAVYGAGDFVGGLATRRASALFVVGAGQIAGLLALAVLAPALPYESVARTDLLWGAASGLSTAVGITLLYQALATGRMSVVAPVTALCALSVPVLYSFATSGHPGIVATIGIALAAAAVALVSHEPDRAATDADGGAARKAFALAIGAGLGIGVFYVLLKHTAPGSGLWPLVAGRAVSSTLFAVAAVATIGRWRRAPAPDAALWAAAVGSGLLDATANALYLVASRHGDLAVVATLTSLYPASTVLLAVAVLRERLRTVQLAGLALAACAIVAIAPAG